jgi:predicted dehydrogenase
MTQWRHLFSLEIFLEKGCLTLNGLKTGSGTYGKEELSILKRNLNKTGGIVSTVDKIFEIDMSWDSEVSYFLDLAKRGTSIEIGNSTDALNVMKVVDNIYRSSK